MKRHRYLLFILPLAIALSSCEKEVNLDFSENERLVVFSNFSDKNDLEVLVYTTKSSLSSGKIIHFPTDATVMVYSSGELLEVLELVPGNEESGIPFYYRSKSISPQIGVIYTIRVSVPGYQVVTATNSIPEAVPIQSVQFSNSLSKEIDDETSINFKAAITISDPPDVANFYHIILYQELIPFQIGESGDTILGSKIYAKPKKLLLDLGTPAVIHYDGYSLLAKDETFNGRQATFSVEGAYVFNSNVHLPGKFLVELRSVSEAYYYYHSTLTIQQEGGDGPLSPGVVVFDNIDNGVGVFAGYSSSFDYFDFGN